jgi:hypothetical protein
MILSVLADQLGMTMAGWRKIPWRPVNTGDVRGKEKKVNEEQNCQALNDRSGRWHDRSGKEEK